MKQNRFMNWRNMISTKVLLINISSIIFRKSKLNFENIKTSFVKVNFFNNSILINRNQLDKLCNIMDNDNNASSLTNLTKSITQKSSDAVTADVKISSDLYDKNLFNNKLRMMYLNNSGKISIKNL